MSMTWEKAIAWEQQWWGNCCNTLGEEIKQTLYAERMGLQFLHDGKSPYNIDLAGRSVIDIGGGPCSLLLKCRNFEQGMIVDPCRFPDWVWRRYRCHDVLVIQQPAETLDPCLNPFDEAWIYNTLQHTDRPGIVCRKAREWGRIVRVFEWIDTEVNDGHPHSLTRELLDDWFHGHGRVEKVNERQCVGTCWYGIFKGEKYNQSHGRSEGRS